MSNPKKSGTILVKKAVNKPNDRAEKCYTVQDLIIKLKRFDPASRVGVISRDGFLSVFQEGGEGARQRDDPALLRRARRRLRAQGERAQNWLKPVRPSEVLAAIVGSQPLTRPDITKRLWAHIRKNGLQDQRNRRNIICDDKLRALFKKDVIGMFEMSKVVKKNYKEV